MARGFVTKTGKKYRLNTDFAKEFGSARENNRLKMVEVLKYHTVKVLKNMEYYYFVDTKMSFV